MILLTGHRGAGKTTFLRLTQFAELEMFKDYSFFDLDEEIQAKAKKSISEIFSDLGEKGFRELEQQTLSGLAQENVMISVGAGCNLEAWKDKARVVWIRRVTDANGRIFLYRPRIRPAVSDWQESLDLYMERGRLYSKWAHQSWYIPEYIDDLKKLIPMFWQRNLCKYFEKGIFTVHPDSHTIHGQCMLELRDDLLNVDQIKQIVEQWPQRKYMISFRTKNPDLSLLQQFGQSENIYDWDLNINTVPKDILNLPKSQICFSSHTDQPPAGSGLLKWAPLVTQWEELMKGHLWWQKDPEHRAFFPRSIEGRWQWYRELFGQQMAFYFFREGDGSSLDQAFWWQRELLPEKFESFAAVLGSPIRHSWTPGKQRDFFKAYSMPVVAILIREEEWAEAIPVLEKLGLRAAAVTSPLKKLSAHLVKKPDARIKQLEACNTLAFVNGEWIGTNTDIDGVAALKEAPFTKDIAMWGSGSLAPTVKAAWPEVQVVSQRNGEALAKTLNPSVVIWSVGRSRHRQWPPDHWMPKLVLDLNYMEDSPGREFAKMVGADYVSGEGMFLKQAEAQQVFWQGVL